jgi:hypothetical protein
VADGSGREASGQPLRVADRQEPQPNQNGRQDVRSESSQEIAAEDGLTSAQTEFFHSTSFGDGQSVLDTIETQVERLLLEGIAKSTRNRVVGEIREIDATLRGNPGVGTANASSIPIRRSRRGSSPSDCFSGDGTGAPGFAGCCQAGAGRVDHDRGVCQPCAARAATKRAFSRVVSSSLPALSAKACHFARIVAHQA